MGAAPFLRIELMCVAWASILEEGRQSGELSIAGQPDALNEKVLRDARRSCFCRRGNEPDVFP